MKSYLDIVVAAYGGIITDASLTWPQLAKGLDHDLGRIRSAAEHRGLGFFTLTLPDYGRAIDNGLDTGLLDLSKIPLGIKRRKGVPLLFGDILLRVFDNSMTLHKSPCIDSIFFLRQLCYLAKKLKVECTSDRLEEAVSDFFEIERSLLEPYQDTWGSENPSWKPRFGHPYPGGHIGVDGSPNGLPTSILSEDQWDKFRLLCRRVTSSFGVPDWWGFKPKHGPGAVYERTGWESKYDFPNWPSRLERVFPFDWYGSGRLWPEHVPVDEDLPSRLIAVPKSAKGPRLICSEPIAHQWMQQSVLRWLEGRIEDSILGTSITLRSQENSRKRALIGSLDRSLCTVDLSSASDRLTCNLVEYVFQGSEILDAFHAIRTRVVEQEISKLNPHRVQLKKFSTQGSGVTFPVQSIVFALLSVFALRVSEGREDDWHDLENDFRRVTVFGDDIIAPNHAYRAIHSIFTECGLKVNSDKSYSLGNFRESCGMDAYLGHDVTPAYILQPYADTPERTASYVAMVNNFHLRGLWYTSSNLESYMPRRICQRLPVMVVDDYALSANDSWRRDIGRSGSLCLRSFVGSEFMHLPQRKCVNLHHLEYKTLKISQKDNRVHGRWDSRLSQFFFEDPDPWLPWVSGQPGRAKLSIRLAWVPLT